MSIADTISIPSTTSLNTSPCRLPTPKEVRERRAREAGQTIVACPLCGHPATQETLLATRPGQGTVRRTVVRCLRKDANPHCPVSVSEVADDSPRHDHPGQQNATGAHPGPEEEHMPNRTCATCGADISERGHRAQWCETCTALRKAERDRAFRERRRQAGSGLVSSTPAPASPPAGAAPESAGFRGGPVADQAPLALRVSVLDLAQRLPQVPEARALVRAVLALSPERQDLLRRLLEDAEEVAA